MKNPASTENHYSLNFQFLSILSLPTPFGVLEKKALNKTSPYAANSNSYMQDFSEKSCLANIHWNWAYHKIKLHFYDSAHYLTFPTYWIAVIVLDDWQNWCNCLRSLLIILMGYKLKQYYKRPFLRWAKRLNEKRKKKSHLLCSKKTVSVLELWAKNHWWRFQMDSYQHGRSLSFSFCSFFW